MSRLGKLPVKLNAGTTAELKAGVLTIKGPKGELKQAIHEQVNIAIKDGEVLVTVKNPDIKKERALWGLFRSLINNMAAGVNDGFERKLQVNGVGYRVAMQGNKLVLSVGFSHPVEMELPQGISGKVEANVITVSGIDKQAVGEFAAQVRKVKKPEPYKGKGIKYLEEVIRRKEGKTAAK